MASRILMIVGDYVEDYEAMVPLQILQCAEHQVDTVCPDKQAGDYVLTAIHDFDGAQTYSEKPGHRFAITSDFASVNPDDYDALVLPGGTANADALRMEEDAVALTRAMVAAGKPVAVICHGAWILTEADAVKGRRMTSYPSLKTDLRNAGATWVDEEVVVDTAGPLVSSRTPEDLPAFNRELVEVFAG